MKPLPTDWVNRKVWVADFEFQAEAGHHTKPWCGVFFELHSGTTHRLQFNNGKPHPTCPVGPEDVLVAFFVTAELSCFLALGWTFPGRIFDLYAESKVRLGNQLPLGCTSWGLLGMATAAGIPCMDAAEKYLFREIAIRGPEDDAQRAALLDYCAVDVKTTAELARRTAAATHTGQAYFRGAYMAAVARMEHQGIPLNQDLWNRLRHHWATLMDKQTSRVNREWPVYVQDKNEKWGKNLQKWVAAMVARGIDWPKTATGRPKTDSDTLRDMARIHPRLNALREIETMRGAFRLGLGLPVGPDGRNRCMLSAFGTVTGRHTPSNAEFIFGPSVWLRSLIQAPPGRCVIYSDLAAAEIGIAAALSKDPNLLADYVGGDPYLTFAREAGLAPATATKKTHARERDICKRLLLAVNYGMGPKSLAFSLGISIFEAGELMAVHRRRYRVFWGWVADVIATAKAGKPLTTPLGWRWQAGSDTRGRPELNIRAAQNWPCQSACGDVLRVAVVRLTKAGVQICATIHDAILVEGPDSQADVLAHQIKEVWAQAAQDVLGVRLRSDATILRSGESYSDGRGAATFASVMELLAEAEGEGAGHQAGTLPM